MTTLITYSTTLPFFLFITSENSSVSGGQVQVTTSFIWTRLTNCSLQLCRALQPNFNMRNMEDIAENTHHTDLAGASLTPELVATAALFLASGESAFISGHNLVLDGGSTTRKENFWRVPTHDSKI